MQLVTFVGSDEGAWRITRMMPVAGESLPPARAVHIEPGTQKLNGTWRLSGLASNLRYTTRSELSALDAIQPQLARAGAVLGALIPIKKRAAWWELAQDERRKIFEETSRHTSIGLAYLPAIARKLHHSRDLGEPFDFLTWFEFAPADEPAFDELRGRLRETPEWEFVEREVDIRMARSEGKN